MPDVTILIPVHNRARFLARAIDAALDQVHECEILVFDDGSTEDIRSVCEGKRRVQYVRSETNLGECRARNEMLRYVNTPYAAALDSDDSCSAWRILWQLKTMQLCRAVYSRTSVALTPHWPANSCKAPMLARRHSYVFPTAMFATDAARQVRWQTPAEGVTFGCNVLFELEMTLRHGPGIHVPLELYYRDTEAPDRLSRKYKTTWEGYDALMEKQVAKKRALLAQLSARSIPRWPRVLTEDELKATTLPYLCIRGE